MTLLNHPVLRAVIGGWVVDVTVASGTRFIWGPYPERKDATAQAKRLRTLPWLVTDAAEEARARTRRPPAQGQPPLFSEEGETQ